MLRGKDEVVRGVRMIVNNKIWERPIQLICPLEIKSTLSAEELNRKIQLASKKEEAVEVVERPGRAPGRAAKDRGSARTKRMLEDN